MRRLMLRPASLGRVRWRSPTGMRPGGARGQGQTPAGSVRVRGSGRQCRGESQPGGMPARLVGNGSEFGQPFRLADFLRLCWKGPSGLTHESSSEPTAEIGVLGPKHERAQGNDDRGDADHEGHQPPPIAGRRCVRRPCGGDIWSREAPRDHPPSPRDDPTKVYANSPRFRWSRQASPGAPCWVWRECSPRVERNAMIAPRTRVYHDGVVEAEGFPVAEVSEHLARLARSCGSICAGRRGATPRARGGTRAA